MSIKPRAARTLEALACLALGAVQTAAFGDASAGPAAALPLLTLAVLAWRLQTATVSRAALLAWCYSLGWLAWGTGWLFISMHRYGGLPAPLAVAAVCALSAFLSLYLALAGALYARWRRGTPGDALLFAALLLLAELARGVVFTGFPWLGLGYAVVDTPLAAWAPWVGVYGLGAWQGGLAVLLALSLAGPARRRAWAAGVGSLLVLALPWLLQPNSGYTRPTRTLSVALLQPQVAQDEKFAAERMPEALAWTAEALVQSRADLVIGPETVVPLLPEQLDEFAPGYWASLRAAFATPGRAALFGMPLGNFEQGYTNSVVGLTPDTLASGRDYRYDKHHLVPFGEFIPLGFRWFTEMMNIPLGDFARGAVDQPSLRVQGERLAPHVCYEDLFGEELAARFRDPASAPTVLVNVSNIGWFGPGGTTDIIGQHLNISRLRALEFQRPVLRATNTGATAAIDHQGRVTARLPAYTRGVLTAQVQGREGLTPYAAWVSRLGLWPWLVLALGVLVWAARRSPAADALEAERAA